MPDGGEWWADSRLIFEELLRRDPNLWRDAQSPYIRNLKATPLMVGGRLFINMPTSQTASIDAATGQTLWVYNPKTYEAGTTTMSARWNQRGVAYWSDGPERNDERIFFGTGNGYLICVDAKTGRPCPDFGEDGWLDLTADLPRATRGERDWLNALLYSVQSAPLVVGDTVVTPGLDLLLQHQQGGATRLDARVRRPYGANAMDLSHDSAGRRARQRLVARRLVAPHRQGGCLDDDERRPGAGSPVSADQHGGARLLRRASPG